MRADGNEKLNGPIYTSEVWCRRFRVFANRYFEAWKAGFSLSKQNRPRKQERIRLPTNNRINVALKMAASTLRLSNTYLGAQFRRLRTKLGAPIAIKAMAAKLARLVYRMLRYGMKYVDHGAAFYQAQHRQLQIKQLKRKATKLGFQIVQAPVA